jgi:DNA polymerase-3 subunit delta
MAAKKSDEISFEELESSIRQKRFKPLYYFFGEEDYSIDELTKLIIKNSLDEGTKSFNLDVIDTNSVNAKELVALASSYPMMSDRRVILVRDVNRFFMSETNREIMQRYFQNPSMTTIMVMVGNKPDGRTAVMKTLKENGILLEFKSLYDNQIPAWITKHAGDFGKKISGEGAELLAQYVGNSMREIHSELEKLSIYVANKSTIDEQDVNALIGVSKVYNIFALQKSIGEKNISKSMIILENMLDNGEQSLGIIVMLAKYFQKLWILKCTQFQSDAEVASVFGISPFFVKEYRNAVSNYKINEIENSFSALLEADEALKTSSSEERMSMTLLLYKIMKTQQFSLNNGNYSE